MQPVSSTMLALHDLSSVDADLEQIQNRLARLSDCERQYQAALSEKIKSIKVSAHPAAQQIAESESRIAALKVQKRELLEAINAGKTALHTVNEVLETLDNAEGWSTWDVMGGGLMAGSCQVCGTGRCAGTNRTASSGTAAVQN